MNGYLALILTGHVPYLRAAGREPEGEDLLHMTIADALVRMHSEIRIAGGILRLRDRESDVTLQRAIARAMNSNESSNSRINAFACLRTADGTISAVSSSPNRKIGSRSLRRRFAASPCSRS